MTTARTFLRFALAGLFANVMAAACIVNSDGKDGDNEQCDAGSYKDCTCADGTESQRKCNSSGSGYGQCICDGSAIGGSGNGSGGEGTGNTGTEAGSGNSTAGKTSTYGGETGEGGTPSTPNGGSPAEVGGAGGTPGEVDPGICGGDETDSCADCYQQGCCDQWTACVDDESETCLDEFLNIVTECSEVPRQEGNVSTADFQACVAAQTPAGGGWSSGLSPLTVDMVNCMAGEDEGGWEGSPWGNLACKAGCFDQQ